MILHCSHHKCLTVYFSNVLNAVAAQQGCVYASFSADDSPPGDADWLLCEDSSVDLAGIPHHARITHVVRDPRDLLVSAYFYHLRCDEDWCVRPDMGFERVPPGYSYQDYLAGLPLAEGLRLELDTVTRYVFEAMETWDFDDPRCLELKFEDIMADEPGWFDRVFGWYGLGWLARRRALQAVRRFSLNHRTPGQWLRDRVGDRDGNTAGGHPNPESKDWRHLFDEPFRQNFHDRWGNLVRRLGYAPE